MVNAITYVGVGILLVIVLIIKFMFNRKIKREAITYEKIRNPDDTEFESEDGWAGGSDSSVDLGKGNLDEGGDGGEQRGRRWFSRKQRRAIRDERDYKTTESNSITIPDLE